ncbi:MAG: hypothetical protein JWN44_4539 [Myxococcales bacterium]|nr:hypothetical protein [Myxococcales bacterium]
MAIALTTWLASFLIVVLWILLHFKRLDSWCVYAGSATRWSARQPLYSSGIDGFQYLPQAALVFGAFAKLGVPLGDLAWRAVTWALLAHAVWRSTTLLSSQGTKPRFLVATALVVGPAMSSLLTGQANLATAGLMLHAAVDLCNGRWWRATAWMILGLAVKPIMAAMILLACVSRPRIVPGIAVGLLLLALVPFALAPANYVLAEYRAWLAKLVASSAPDRFFEDLRGLLHSIGVAVPHRVLGVVRLLGALGAALLCLDIRRRWREPEAGLLLFAVAGTYLMLFNPRTQPNSYVILVPAVALAAALYLLQERYRAAAALMLIAASWSGTTTLTALWLKPLTCLIFCGLLVREILREELLLL